MVSTGTPFTGLYAQVEVVSLTLIPGKEKGNYNLLPRCSREGVRAGEAGELRARRAGAEVQRQETKEPRPYRQGQGGQALADPKGKQKTLRTAKLRCCRELEVRAPTLACLPLHTRGTEVQGKGRTSG